MVNRRGLVVLVIAAGMGIAVAKGVSVWMTRQVESEVAKRLGEAGTVVSVAIASRDIASSASITSDDISVVKFPEGSVPQGSIAAADLLTGRITRTKIFSGEPLLEQKLAPKGSHGGLQTVIPPGYRGMTVKVNDVSGVAGFILPGTRVDVVSVIKQQKSEMPVAKMVLQGIDVLAVDQVIDVVDNKPKEASAITLMVTPADAEKLALASEEGKIRLALRPYSDDAVAATPGVSTTALVSRPVSGPIPRKIQVEVIENDRRFQQPLGKEDQGPTAQLTR